MDYQSLLEKHKKKTISKEELSKIFHLNDTAQLYGAIEACVASDLLSAVKSSKTDGNLRYPVYMKCRIVIHEIDYI